MTDKYSISSEERGGAEIYILREGENAYAEVAPSLGNNCFAFSAGAPVLEPVAFEEFRQR